jgi:hypothetical protein
MNTSTVLKMDDSFDGFSPVDGESLPKALCHKALCLDVDNSTWYIYWHKNYDPKAETGDTAYDVDKWRAQG